MDIGLHDTIFGLFNCEWLLPATVIFLSGHFAYLPFLKALLRKMRVRGQYIVPVTNTIWRMSLKSIGVIMMFGHLGGEWNIMYWRDRLNNELTKCKMHEEIKISGFMMIYILYTAFILEDFVYVLVNTGFTSNELFQKQLFLGIFFLANHTKCTLFMTPLVCVSDWSEVIELGAKVILLVSKHLKSNIIRYLSKVVLSFAVCWWCVTYLYVYPLFLIWMTWSIAKANLDMIIILNTLTWIYVVVTVLTSTFLRMIGSICLKSDERPCIVEYYLFGCDPWLLKITNSDRRSYALVFEDDEFHRPYHKNLNTLRSFLYTRNIVMRKVRAIRQRKESLDSNRRTIIEEQHCYKRTS